LLDASEDLLPSSAQESLPAILVSLGLTSSQVEAVLAVLTVLVDDVDVERSQLQIELILRSLNPSSAKPPVRALP